MPKKSQTLDFSGCILRNSYSVTLTGNAQISSYFHQFFVPFFFGEFISLQQFGFLLHMSLCFVDLVVYPHEELYSLAQLMSDK